MKPDEHHGKRSFRIQFSGADEVVAKKLFGSSTPKWNDNFRPIPGVESTYQTEKPSGFADLHPLIEGILSFARDVSAIVVAEWLFECLKHRATSLRINGKQTEIDKKSIQRALEEESDSDDTSSEQG